MSEDSGKTKRAIQYSDELAQEIIDRYSEGETIAEICRDNPNMPNAGTVIGKWVNDKPNFGKLYARARDAFLAANIDKALQIAKEAEEPVRYEIELKDGTKKIVTDLNATKARIQSARLRIDAIMRIAALVAPDRYGQRLKVEHSGGISMAGVDDERLNAMIAKQLESVGLLAMLREWLDEEKLSRVLDLFRVITLPSAPPTPTAPAIVIPPPQEQQHEQSDTGSISNA